MNSFKTHTCLENFYKIIIQISFAFFIGKCNFNSEWIRYDPRLYNVCASKRNKGSTHPVWHAIPRPRTRISWLSARNRVSVHRCLPTTPIPWCFDHRSLNCYELCLPPSSPLPNCRCAMPALSTGRPTIRPFRPSRI